MFSSLKLGKPFGIDLFVHPTFWVLPVLILLGGAASGDLAGAATDVAVVLGVFVCVALHEFGHALAAAYYGIRTRHITLYPIGGVAALERMPERPRYEIVVALAGPAVNVVIALGLLFGLFLGLIAMPNSFSLDGLGWFDQYVLKLLVVNVGLVAFNMIPAFPMDGGRVFRALLSTVMNRVDATQVAVTVGSILAGIFVLSGLGLLPNPVFGEGTHFGLVLVGGVVFLLGRAELAQVRAVQAHRDEMRRRQEEYDDPTQPPIAEVISPPRFTGWKYDPERRVWSEWHDGELIREHPAF